ncbi:MAG: Glutamate-binding protein of ABC transporter system [uncultured Nocardioidaceae bacterium]|uniref:Glutamate-binding protein of ABC transporter system n=1 Tax=uncultured Nocardioidaceae bacterium TaxID=253824 RepID=A0A6J4MIG4_9ACTN|nr:MAG: Glutamate-binding protein of ABC transporter system [uncultured Nocardioidaceae bacterium]
MRFTRTKAVVAAAGLALALAGCGEDGGGSSEYEVVENPEFEAGTSLAKFAEEGSITIGVKTDQPGIGFLEPGAEDPTGFDIEMGKIIAGQMGISADNITWKETVSDNREPFLQKGTVDLVLASYSIDDEERRNIVGQAGPYYVTGQQLLVAANDDSIGGPEDLDGKKVCSVTGSTSIETVEKEYGAKPIPFDTYSACVNQLQNGSVDAVTTDGAILLGYVAQDPENLKVVGPEFSEERYGIGFEKGDTAMCDFLKKEIEESYDNGTWEQAFKSTLGESGVETPEPPAVDDICFTD